MEFTCCIIGRTQLAVDCSKILLHNGIIIRHVFTDDKSFQEWAESLKIEVHSIAHFESKSKLPLDLSSISNFFGNFDFLFSIVNDVIISEYVLKSVKRCPINYHNGPLPKYAGMNAAHWALLNGEKTHGIVWHIMEKTIDTGAILTKKEILIDDSDDITKLNWTCREAAKESLTELCNHITSQSLNPVVQKEKCTMKYALRDMPTAFCVLPFNCSAQKVANLFRATYDFGEIKNDYNIHSLYSQQVNIMGLPKLFLPYYNKVVIVTGISVLNERSVQYAPGTVVSVLDHLRISTEDNDIMITGLMDLDGSPIAKPFASSIPCLKTKNVSLSDAQEHASNLWKISKYSLHGKKEQEYLYKVYLDAQDNLISPLVWPYYSFSQSHSSFSQENNALKKFTIYHVCLDTVKSVVATHKPEVHLLASFVYYLLNLSVTLSGSFDVCLQGLPAGSIETAFILTSLPISLKLEPNIALDKSIDNIAKAISSTMFGKEKEGVRVGAIAADVYLRYSLQPLHNTLAIAISHNDAEVSLSTSHNVIIVCKKANDSLYLDAHFNCKYFDNTNFKSVGEDFGAFFNSTSAIQLCSLDSSLILSSHPALKGKHRDHCPTRLHKPFEAAVTKMPHAIAVIDSDGQWTYSELNHRAESIAIAILNRVQNMQIKRVAYLLSRTCDSLATMLAIMKIGLTFIPLEIDSQLNVILKDSNAEMILIDKGFKRFEDLKDLMHIMVINIELVSSVPGQSMLTMKPSMLTDDSTAVIIYTSGTTGTPKGVLVEHVGLCNIVASVMQTLSLCNEGEFGEYSIYDSSPIFDSIFLQIFCVLWTGGTVLIVPVHPLEKTICHQYYPHMTFFLTTPSKLSLHNPNDFKSLLNVAIGGENPNMDLYSKWKAPNRKLWNVYGPTETSVITTIGLIVDKVHMGMPAHNTQLHILSQHRLRVPLGVTGELYISGIGLASGYTSKEQTEKAFIHDNIRLYRTGDLAFIDKDDSLQFVGRIPTDKQVKFRGMRVELIGIEYCLRQCKGVEYAQVVVEKPAKNISVLVAYVAPHSVSISDIEANLRKMLPTHAVPSLIIPINKNDAKLSMTGKLSFDKSKYIEKLASNFRCPASSLEESILAVFKNHLGIKDDHLFGMDDQFKRYGGDSVIAVSLSDELTHLLELAIEPLDILNSTPADLIKMYFGNAKKNVPIVKSVPITSAGEYSRLSDMQKLFLGMNVLHIGATYNVSFAFEIVGSVNQLLLVSCLEKSLQAIDIDFGTTGNSNAFVKEIDLTSLCYNEAKAVSLQMAQKDACTPMDLTLCPYRCTLYYVCKGNYILTLLFHHIIFDYHSWKNFAELFQELYHSGDILSTNKLTPFSNYSMDEHQHYYAKEQEINKFWKDHLHSCPLHISFPHCFMESSELHYRGNKFVHPLGNNRYDDIAKLSKALDIHPSCFFIISFAVLIYQLSRQNNFGIGIVFNRRTTADFKRIIGFVTKTLIFHFSSEILNKPLPFILRHIQSWQENAMKNGSIPFEELIQILGYNASYKGYHIPQFLFNFISNAKKPTIKLENDVNVNYLPLETHTCKGELVLDVSYSEDLSYTWEYNSLIFSEETISQCINESYLHIMDHILKNILCKAAVENCSSLLQTKSCISAQQPIYSGEPTTIPFSASQKELANIIFDTSQAMWGLFNSTCSFKISPNFTTEQINQSVYKCIGNFHYLSSVVNGNNDSLCLANLKIHITVENAKDDTERKAIICREQQWPFSLHTGPLFHITLICSTAQKELLLSASQILLDEHSLHRLAWHLNNYIINKPDLSISMSSVDLPISFARKIGEEYVAKHCEMPPRLMSNFAISLSSLQHMNFNHEIVSKRAVEFSCAFSALFLWHIHKTSHVQLCFLQSPQNNSLGSEENIIPIDQKLDKKMTFNHLLDQISDNGALHSNCKPQCYWKLQKDFDPYSNYFQPYHELLVEMVDYDINLLEFNYPRTFKLHLKFDIINGTVLLTSNVDPEQTNVIHNIFDCIIKQFNHSEITALNSPICTLIENNISPSTAIGEKHEIEQDLKQMITSSLNNYSGIIALCNSSSSDMMTYEELGKQSDLLASKLKKLLSNGIVAILVAGNFELHVAVTAAILSKFTFSILDPFEKPEMLSKLISASQASLVLFDTCCLTTVESMYLLCPVNFILVDVYVDPLVCLSNHTADKNLQQLDINSYIVFTSGSTGEPKAVPVPNSSLCNFLLWHKMVLLPCKGPLNWLQFSNFSFDLCIAEIVGQLYNGNTFFVIDQKRKLDLEGYFLKRLTSCNIDGVHVVPTFLKYLLKAVSDTNKTFPSLSHVFSGGEKLTKEMCIQFFKHFKDVSLHNWAGPAECSIAISHCLIHCSTCFSSNIPVGLPVWNSEIRIVDPDSLEVVPKTILGEVVVSGVPVFEGYINSKNEIPFYVDENGKKCYRTSDVGFINNNNHLVLIDRLGSFRKVSGQSVDLEGVRALINRLTIPSVEDVIVRIIEDGNGESTFLGCFPIVSEPVEEDKIQSVLVKSLPKQCTPIVVKCFKQQDLPMLASGKTDYKALQLIANKKKCTPSENVASNNFDSILYTCLSAVVSYDIPKSSSWIVRTLDSFGLSSMQKVQFYEKICSSGVHVDISAILMPHSLRSISFKMSWKTTPQVSTIQPIIKFAPGGLHHSKDEPIAILAMRVNVQGAKSFSELWDIIINSKEEITHGLPCKNDIRASVLGKYVGSRGTVTEKEMFDAEVFEISAFQADLIDPQQRVLLQMVWEALEEAGYDPVKYSKNGRIGCFAGVEFPTYLLHSIKNTDGTHEDDIIWNNLRDNASLLLGRLLDFRGPCITVANNCATFSVALHCARNSLLRGECDIAVVACSNLSADETGYFSREGDIYSFDGHCKPFSKSATGTVMSDGVTVAILKVLSDAKRDSDNILCTIRGSAVGSDGALAKKHQYVPSAAGQADTLEQLFKSSGIDPRTITLVEAHGTGTRIGDQVELESLTTVFKKFGYPSEWKCALGSIKGNLGHIGVSAAGVSVAKVALAFNNGMLPSSINCEDPLPDLNSPFEIVQISKPWICPSSVDHNRRALVHSVGAMGINSAIILEEYIKEDQNASVTEDLWFPVCISARSKWSLEHICHRLKALLSHNKGIGSPSLLLQNIAYTLLIGRRFLPLRTTTVVQSLGQLDEWLSFAFNSPITAHTRDSMCTIFSGQGYSIESPSHTFSSLAKLLPEFGKVVAKCCNILEMSYPEHFADLTDMLIQGTPIAHLKLECIRIQHVLIVIFQVAIFSVLEISGYTPACVMGHSLGEYTAAYVAGLFSLESLLKIVFNRAQMIEKSVPAGKMLAVHLSGNDFSSRYASFIHNIEVACYNSPNHCVISGSNDGVAEIFQRLNKDKVKCRYLSVQYAYHHSSLRCIENNFSQFLKRIPFGSLKYMLVTSTDVNVYLPGSTLNYSYFVKQLTSPVNFCKACDVLFHNGLQINKEASITPVVTEIGIRNIIQSFLSVNDRNPKMDVITFSLNTANDIKLVLNSLTSLWKSGTDIQIQDTSIFSTAKRIQLPTYPFDMKRHWICKQYVSQSEQKITPLQAGIDQPSASLDSILEYINGFSVQGNGIDESMSQMTIRERILRNFNVDVAALLEQKRSPKEIAEFVLATYVGPQPSVLHAKTYLTPNSTAKINFFILHATRGNLYSFEPIASCLSFMFQIYALYIPVSALKCGSMESYAEYFLSEITAVQPVGPYNIMGFSFGAWIAHALVSILNTKGEETVLFMLDPIPFQTIDEDVLKNPHRLVQTVIKYGNEFIQNALHYSESDVLLNFIQNFCEQYSLLLNYKHSYQPVSSLTTVILARDGIALLEDQKYSSPTFWNSLCSSDKLMIKLVPGNHAACIGPTYCHYITDIVLQVFNVQIENATVLISSVQNIQGNWKLQSCYGTDDAKQNLNMTAIDHSHLKIINTTYICIIPKVIEFLAELKMSECREIAGFLNSAGTVETTQGSSEMQFHVECSFLYSENLPYQIKATVKVSRGILLLCIDNIVFSFSKI